MSVSGPVASVSIRPDRLDTLIRRHPWVFSGAIRSVEGTPADGEIVDVLESDGRFAGRGYWHSTSQIAVHMLSWDRTPIDAEFWRNRLARALSAREAEFRRGDAPCACRLVNAESDGLPGLIVDQYGDWLVLQALTVGIDRRKSEIAAMLRALRPGLRGIYERSDADVRAKEGLPPATGVLAGEEPPSPIEIVENGLRYRVDVRVGHKTGFYLDQRPNRAILRESFQRESFQREAVQGAAVLNCFAYTGGFSLAARAGGASRAISVDSSAEALALARQNLALNGFSAGDDDFVVGDVFQVLRGYREAGTRFDAIVLDPPKFVQHKGQLERASRGYKDINLLAFGLLKPGALLMTFSCSGLVSPDLFQKIVFGALVDSGREAQILARLTAGPDHPVALTFPEGLYLKGLLCRVW